MHEIAQETVNDAKDTDNPLAHGAVVMEPGTGRILGLGLNRVFSYDQSDNGQHSNPSFDRVGNYPNTVNPVLGGGPTGGYQAGSTFKVFTMLAALDAGYPLDTDINSPNRVATSFIGHHRLRRAMVPKNGSASMAGNRDMWSGFGMSVNTYFAQLIDRVGPTRPSRWPSAWASSGEARATPTTPPRSVAAAGVRSRSASPTSSRSR
ncbi:hypothetical protein GCM10029992_00180 [Glycomyces albus]